MLGWLVYEHGIEPHVTVFKSTRQDGTFSRDDFTYDHWRNGDVYSRPAEQDANHDRLTCE